MNELTIGPETAAAYRHCAAIAHASGSSFLATFWMFPKEQRLALHAIYAFCRMADDIADDPNVRGDRRRLIEEWRRELEDAYLGKSSHPIGIALGHSANRFRLRQEWFSDLLDGVESDLCGDVIVTFEDLERYCYRVASTIGLLVVSVRGLDSPAVHEYATNLGIAVQLTNVLRDVGEDARTGRIYLASDDMRRLGVSREDLLASEPSENLRILLATYAEKARIRYEQAQRVLPTEFQRQARPAQAMGAIYRELLDRLHAERFPCLSRVVRLSKPKRVSIAARVWLGAQEQA
jgi:15-cis-phytoene synthase